MTTAVAIKLEWTWKSPEGLGRADCWVAAQSSDSVGVEEGGPRMGTSNKFPGDTDAAGVHTTWATGLKLTMTPFSREALGAMGKSFPRPGSTYSKDLCYLALTKPFPWTHMLLSTSKSLKLWLGFLTLFIWNPPGEQWAPREKVPEPHCWARECSRYVNGCVSRRSAGSRKGWTGEQARRSAWQSHFPMETKQAKARGPVKKVKIII